MARKHHGTDSSELLQFDSRTKAVAAQAYTMDNMKEKISKVRGIATSSSKDDIIQVLHHFDGDVDKSIDAYKRDGAQEILSQWNAIPNRRGKGGNNQKRNKKKKHKEGGETSTQEPSVPLNNNNIEKPTHPRIETIGQHNGHVSFNNNNMPKENPSTVQSQPRRDNRSRGGDPKPHQGKTTSSSPRREPTRPDNQSRLKERPKEVHIEGGSKGQKPSTGQGGKRQQQRSAQGSRGDADKQRPSQQSGRRRNVSEGSDKVGKADRERTISESSSSQDPSKPKKSSSMIEKVSKDLQRTQVSLTRHKNLLNEEFDRSEKRLRKAFEDSRKTLEHREMEMMRQLKEVKRSATILLDKRQERAVELKMQTGRAPSMSEQQLNELRGEIKHFVSDRKVDEEIGRTMRFTWNPDPVELAIKSLGEVIPIKTTYSTRRPSITSDTSGTFSRTTSVSEDPSGPLSRSTSRIDSSVPPTPTTPDMDMKAEVENFAARLQRSLDSRGGPRRPRNDRSRSQGRPLKNEQRGPKNPGQKNEKSAPRNQGQQQNRDNKEQGQQGRRNRGGPNRGKDQGPRRDRDRLSSSSSTGKGEEESPDGSPKKSRSQRRREQYRRRQFDRDGENGDDKQEPRDAKQAPKDTKLNGNAKQEPKDAKLNGNAKQEPKDSKLNGHAKQEAKDSKQEPKDAKLNGHAKQGPKDSKPTNKDSQPKENNVKTNDSNPKSSTEIKDDKVDDAKPLVNGTDVPETEVEHENVADSKAERPKELNITQNGPKVEIESQNVVNHIEQEDNSSDKKVILNGDVHLNDEPIKDEIHNCNDKPIMNGGLSSGGEVSPSEPVKESGDGGLPQRQPRERKERQKVTPEVVKEVSAMNGVVATGDGVLATEENGEEETAVDH